MFQCLLNAANHRLAHAVGIAKTDFAFCRVHIYIDSAGIELNKKECNRILPFHKSCVVAFADGPGDKIAFNRPAVYEHELLAAGLSAETCLTDKTTDSEFLGRQRRSLRPGAATIRRRISPGSDRRALR